MNSAHPSLLVVLYSQGGSFPKKYCIAKYACYQIPPAPPSFVSLDRSTLGILLIHMKRSTQCIPMYSTTTTTTTTTAATRLVRCVHGTVQDQIGHQLGISEEWRDTRVRRLARLSNELFLGAEHVEGLYLERWVGGWVGVGMRISIV